MAETMAAMESLVPSVPGLAEHGSLPSIKPLAQSDEAKLTRMACELTDLACQWALLPESATDIQPPPMQFEMGKLICFTMLPASLRLLAAVGPFLATSVEEMASDLFSSHLRSASSAFQELGCAIAAARGDEQHPGHQWVASAQAQDFAPMQAFGDAVGQLLEDTATKLDQLITTVHAETSSILEVTANWENFLNPLNLAELKLIFKSAKMAQAPPLVEKLDHLAQKAKAIGEVLHSHGLSSVGSKLTFIMQGTEPFFERVQVLKTLIGSGAILTVMELPPGERGSVATKVMKNLRRQQLSHRIPDRLMTMLQELVSEQT